MTTTFEIGSREDKIDRLAKNMRRHADAIDALANDVEQWGDADVPSPRKALALIERAARLRRDAERFYTSEFIGERTKAVYHNEACAIGAGMGLNDRGDLAYSLMYALGEFEKVETGQYTHLARSQSLTAVKASGLRVHASNCRVVAQMLDNLAAGEIRFIR